MARRGIRIHQSIAIAIALTLAAPVVGLADGKKHFKEGMKYEANRQWDKAAEQFALALADSPSNPEYDLHLKRALVQAAIMLVERGDTLAEKKDYNAAYTAYRQAFSFDPTNELALIKMRHMLEVQGLPTDMLPQAGDPSGPKLKPDPKDDKSVYMQGVNYNPTRVQVPGIPERRFSRTDVVYRDTNLQTAIEQLAQMMKLNILFDQQVVNLLRSARATIELRDVTYPRALEMLLKTHGLMYAQLDSRTIVVASDNPQTRMKYEPYAVRTFYIKNADATEMRGTITGALPQVKQLTPVKQLNAIVVRDTPSNLELVEQMINSLDKSKAEVLVDVNIYEVSRNDLLQLGNQFATPDTKGTVNLGNIGGLGNNNSIDSAARAHTFIGSLTGATPLGFALGLPPSSISFFQDKGKTKLLASTQVHVLDQEQNTVRIGQRVPIQTASLPTFTGVSVQDQNRANRQAGLATSDLSQGLGGAFLGGIPQIQYENVGLNIDVTPSVYEDEVQMKMKIETTSIDRSTGTLTPTFNQRTMTSVARVKDGQTTLIAGVSSSEDSKEVKGIPIIGLIPILGRFFATPQTTNKQSDVVITVTPHILRRADITEEDHLARAAGDFQSSNNQLRIAQILYLADLEDQQQNQVAANEPAAPAVKPVVEAPQQTAPTHTEAPGVVVQPVPTAAPPPKADIIRQTVSRPGAPTSEPTAQPNQPKRNSVLDDDDDDDEESQASQQTPITVYVRPASPIGAKGQDLYVAVFVNGPGDIMSAHVGLTFDPNILEVKGVRDSGLMSTGGRAELQFQAEPGSVNIEIDRPQGANGASARGQLCLIVFTTKMPGQSTLVLNDSQTFFRTSAGQAPGVKLQSSQVEIR
jgi:general secretion pathway protein D